MPVVPDINVGVDPDKITYSYGATPPLNVNKTLPVLPEQVIADATELVAVIDAGVLLFTV
jgi:hypothetical protein